MINLRSKQVKGAATLIMTVILLTVGTLMIVFSANYGRMQTVSTSNMTRSEEAFAAAEAGLEFGINYLKENYSAITSNPVNGYIPIYSDVNISNVPLANSSSFSVAYSNPEANNYKVLEITSIGTSADGTTTKTVSQQVVSGSILLNIPDNPLTVSGNLDISGSSAIYNLEGNITVETGGTVSFIGNASSTLGASGGSSKSNISNDIVQNSPGLSGDEMEIFNDYFGTDQLVFTKPQFAHQYTSSGNANYSSTLDGMVGTSIWIDQSSSSTVTLNGNIVLGTTAEPVILVVNNGQLTLTGNVTFSGFIFTLGDGSLLNVSGSATASGGIVNIGSAQTSGNASISYSSAVLNNLQSLQTMTYFAKVPGTWRDY